jgi:hypothetical protein
MFNKTMFCFLVFGLLGGCSNPFSSKEKSHLFGVWGAQNVTAPINRISFLDKGRYFENKVQVGVYTVLRSEGGASGAENLVFTTHTIRVDYLSGEQIVITVRTLSHTATEMRLAYISGRGGPPPGDYYKLHTGEGL